MELYSSLSKGKYEQYRSYQPYYGKSDPKPIGDIWSDLICMNISDCGNYLSIEISVDELVEISKDVPFSFSCDKDMRYINFDEFLATAKGFVNYWVKTYAPVLAEDFSITKKIEDKELEEEEFELER